MKLLARLEADFETTTSSIIAPDTIEKESCGSNLNTGKQLCLYVLAYEHVFKLCAAFTLLFGVLLKFVDWVRS